MPYLFLLIACLMLVLSGLVSYIPALQGWDLAQVKWFSQHRTESLNILAMFLSKIGGSVVIGFVVMLWCSRLAWYKKYKTVIFISFGMIGSGMQVWLLKWWIARPRPLEIYHLVQSYGASFPSAHSAYAASFACLLLFLLRKHRYYVWIFLAANSWWIIMGISRVYLGVHYPTDVLTGWSIGFIWISLLWLWFRHNQSGKNNLFLDKNLNEVEQ